ncbi:DUF4998 domain-containing protein [Mucilaginibacter pedocola]|uniref:DUF5013 domain-containing protein n=1 Tax=Mucilaginibacter pedocola TaxID=1792845 RepID=A0A1S9PCP5_9SPHI|nr:DUF4998 domain-containing protein [Mucilaginibacter pedocola]OOQ58754.1 hypothetical protein BC343_08850 [Mucilaginibacter pedocola]
MKNIFRVIVFLMLFAAVAGCRKYNDDYKTFLDGHEITYPGLAGGFGYRAGNLRAVLVWHPSPDPSIKNYVIAWNNGKDSLTVEATSHSPADSMVVSIPNLKEYVYGFRMVAHDNSGGTSVGQELNNVRVYGPVYQSTLLNRGYDLAHPYTLKADGSVDLNFVKPDSGNVSTTIEYTTNASGAKTVVLPAASNTANLPDFKFGTEVKYQSAYKPTRNAADQFNTLTKATYPTVKLIGDITILFIKNAGRPIYRKDSGTGKWGLLRDWLYNDAVVNQNGNTGGGFSTDDGGVVHMESKDWGAAVLDNGKVWQTFDLPAGKYEVEYETGYNGGTFKANELVAKGSTLPDINNLDGALAIFRGDQGNTGGNHTISFTLTETTTVSVGWVVHLELYTYLQFRSIKLRKTE